MKKTPLDWIDEAAEPVRTYRKMVVGWQNSLIVLSALLRAFNDEFLKPEEQKKKDSHQQMREVAMKKLVISSVFELRPQLDHWFRRLDSEGMVSEETKLKKQGVRNLLKEVHRFHSIRNATLHFGDVNEAPDDLLRIYRDIASVDQARLKCILEALLDLGIRLCDHAKAKT